MTASNNWIHSKLPLVSVNDKIKELLSISDKLVLIQQHELERIKSKKLRSKEYNYINALYQHYIINKLPKTYEK